MGNQLSSVILLVASCFDRRLGGHLYLHSTVFLVLNSVNGKILNTGTLNLNQFIN